MKREKNGNDRSSKSSRILFLCASAATLLLAGVLGSMAWVYFHRTLQTVTEINAPITLHITAGNQEAIENLDLGDIDVEDGSAKAYVFCVYGSPADDYILQLAHTTNIPFTYKIYKAAEKGFGLEASKDGCVSYPSESVDESGRVIYYYYEKDQAPLNGAYINLANSAGDGRTATDAYHDDSYGDGTDGSGYDAVQKNAEPLYYQAEVKVSGEEIARGDFCHYYILEVSWEASDKIANNKETDIVYLMAGQSSAQ